jgi:hypothetical protein
LSARYAPVEGDQVPVLVVPDSPVLNQLEEDRSRRRREAVTATQPAMEAAHAAPGYPLYPAYPYYSFHYPTYPAYSYYPFNSAYANFFTSGVQVTRGSIIKGFRA